MFTDLFRLKSKINQILPIVLALILPGLSFYALSEPVFIKIFGFYESWIILSVFIYLFWYFLWFLWDIKQTRGKWIVLIFMIVLIGSVVFAVQELNVNFKSYMLVRFAFGAILFLTIQYALKSQQNIARLQLEKEQIQLENYKAQLKALLTRIDPHFLFNSLNTLRSMVRQKHINSEKFIMSLSDLYRQTLKHTDKATIPLAEEIDVLNSYLFLMKSRNEDAIDVEFNIGQSMYRYQLPTLSLQILVENCFKHNSMTTKMPLNIKITNTEDYYIEVSNNIQPRIANEEESGHGLDLLRKRYELMNIPNGVIVEKDSGRFSVKVKLL